jgi:hypothetical protein
MAAEAETLSATPEPQAAETEGNQAKPGMTTGAVLTGLALLLILAIGLPRWSLIKGYPLNLGGYLPVEAFFLVLAVLVFNRFRGVFALVMGLAAVTWFAPVWHSTVYARSEESIKALAPLAHWLRLTFSGMIETALDSPGRPALLMGVGCLLVFAATAAPAYLISVPVRFLRRRMHWREVAVIFVLLSVGSYSCKSVQWLVGLLGTPHKYDTTARDYKGRFLRPVPIEQQELSDPAVKEDLARLEKDAAAIESIARFKDFRTYKSLKALEKLAADPEDAAAREALKADSWGSEAREALALLEKRGRGHSKLKETLVKLHAAARDQAYFNAREEALDEVRRENPAGFPSYLWPYDLYRFDVRTPEGALKYAEYKEAIKEYSKGWYKRAPLPPKIDVPRRENFTTLGEDGEDVFDAAAYRQHCEQYFRDYRRYQEDRSESRASEWKKFWSYWKGPLSWWLPLLALILIMQVCLAAILRRQWCDHEKLMFPHAEAVRSLVEGEELGSRAKRILNSRALWIGAGISVVIFLFQGLNNYFPAVPSPGLNQISLKTFLSDRPWNNMQKTLNIQPYLVGIAYLLTTEVSLSIWFFALVNQAMRVATMAWGFTRTERWAIHGEIMNSDALYTGAMFVFVFWLIWGGRRHIWYVLRRGLGLVAPDKLEKNEPMSYPLAFWGFWLSVMGIFLWFTLTGLKLWVMAVVMGFYLVLAILITRVVSEAGLVGAAMSWWPFWPNNLFCHLFGFGQAGTFGKMISYKDSWLSPGAAGKKLVPCTVRSLSVFHVIWPAMLFHAQLTPFVLAGFKLTETEPRRKRLLTAVTVLGLLGATAIFAHGTMSVLFEQGADNCKVYAFRAFSWAYNNTLLRDMVTAERMWSPDVFRAGCMLTGGIVMVALLVLRSTFYWWPLHPLGMAAFGLEWGMWFSFLIGWFLKRTALAYGGGEFSQKVNPFFYGLILGHLLMAAFWGIVGICGSGASWLTNIIPATGF